MELACLALERLGKEATEPAITMLAKTIHSSFSRQKDPVVVYDRSATWPGKWRLRPLKGRLTLFRPKKQAGWINSSYRKQISSLAKRLIFDRYIQSNRYRRQDKD